MRKVTITLGDTETEVQELRSRANRGWRKSLEKHFEELGNALQGAGGTDLTDGQSLAHLVKSVSATLLGSVEILTELVKEYAPDLPIDDYSYDSEILEAFTAILGLAYPFGSVLDKIMSTASSMKPPTSQN